MQIREIPPEFSKHHIFKALYFHHWMQKVLREPTFFTTCYLLFVVAQKTVNPRDECLPAGFHIRSC